MGARIDLTGMKYGRLTAVRQLAPRNKRTFWLWSCDCGIEKAINAPHVRSGKIVSCGCYLTEILHSDDHAARCKVAAQNPRTHGLSNLPEYFVWKTMRQRCKNPNQHDYRWYGALGVTVCAAWDDFEVFYADMGPSNGLTLDRIDATGNYEPGNCRWATWEVQRQNKRPKCQQ